MEQRELGETRDSCLSPRGPALMLVLALLVMSRQSARVACESSRSWTMPSALGAGGCGMFLWKLLGKR
jgi:hypothetical protein